MRLDHGQAVIVEPPLELIPMRIEQTAGFAPTVGAMRPNHLDHLTQQQVGQLLLTAGPVQAEFLGGLDVAADRLAVHPRQPADRPQPFAPPPQPPDLSYFEQANLPRSEAQTSALQSLMRISS